MNAASCFPGPAVMVITQFFAVGMTTSVAPYCNWSCTCGTGPAPHVIIDSSDGLPVELMEFSVEAREPA